MQPTRWPSRTAYDGHWPRWNRTRGQWSCCATTPTSANDRPPTCSASRPARSRAACREPWTGSPSTRTLPTSRKGHHMTDETRRIVQESGDRIHVSPPPLDGLLERGHRARRRRRLLTAGAVVVSVCLISGGAVAVGAQLNSGSGHDTV